MAPFMERDILQDEIGARRREKDSLNYYCPGEHDYVQLNMKPKLTRQSRFKNDTIMIQFYIGR